MANVNQGLQTPDANESVNSEAGFAAALADRGVKPDETTSTDTSITSGLETVEPGQDRGPDGRFQQKPVSETPAPEQDTSTDVTPVTSDDPAVAALLAKYDGDPVKALKAAADAQSVIGRQGQQLGSMNEQLAKQQGQIDALLATASRPVTPALSEEQVEETASNLVSAQGGYEQAATRAANEGHTSGDFRVYDAILDQWIIESPINAQRFDLDFQLWKREQAAPTQTVTAVDPWVENRKADESITSTMTRLKSEIGKEAFAAITTVGADNKSPLTAALDSMPKVVLDLIASQDPEEQYSATKLVADRATLLAGATQAAPQQQQESEGGIPDSVQRKLAGASVATAGLRPVTPPAGSPQGKDEAVAKFKSDILAAETTSVASGLTYGSQPAR